MQRTRVTTVRQPLAEVGETALELLVMLLEGRGELRGRRIFRTLLFIPYVFSEIITAIIWLYVFKPGNGLLNVVLQSFIPGFNSTTGVG